MDKEYFIRLSLADGTSIWDIVPYNDQADELVLGLAKVMNLKIRGEALNNAAFLTSFRRLIVKFVIRKICLVNLSTMVNFEVKDQNTIICTIISEKSTKISTLPLIYLSAAISHDAHSRGALLLHGALAEWEGNGVILAGPGGRGKSLASKRLPRHWHSHCDDTTLVVPDDKGAYLAHPWPTWSNLIFNGGGKSWNVENAVPLKSIFFLEQAHKDQIYPICTAQSVCLLNESSKQSSWFMPGYSKKKVLRELRLERFDNICMLAHTVPSYILNICPNGSFWEEIERTLNG